jgi:phage antirepressor YoqD-like protein
MFNIYHIKAVAPGKIQLQGGSEMNKNENGRAVQSKALTTNVVGKSNQCMTVREVAEKLGCHPETVKEHIRALWPGLLVNGKATYLDEAQVTVILEHMKRPVTSGTAKNLQSETVGIETSQRMTVREVAEVLGVTDEAIKKHIRELWPELMQERTTTYLNEEQITEIKLQMRLTTKVASACTSLDIERMTLQVIDYHKSKIAELEAQAAENAPKVDFFDTVADSGDAVSMRAVSAVLNLPGWGRNKIFKFLREAGVLDGCNIPYRNYQERGYFRVVESDWTDPEGEIHIELTTLVYQRGIDFIRQKLTGEAA